MQAGRRGRGDDITENPIFRVPREGIPGIPPILVETPSHTYTPISIGDRRYGADTVPFEDRQAPVPPPRALPPRPRETMASGSSGKASSSRKSSSGGGSKSGSLEAAKKKKKSKKSSSSSKAASASAAASRQNKAAAAAKARTTIKSMYDESEARKNDAAWLGSERLSAAAASLEGYYKRSTMVPGRGRVKKNAATGLFLAEEVGIVDAALKTNGMNREDLTVEAFGCLLEQARR